MIPMQLNSKIEYVVGDAALLENIGEVRALPVFAPEALELLAAFSQRLLHDAAARGFADVMTLGFWCRRAAMHKMQADYADYRWAIGRGMVFHIAPSNVAVNFAYSMIAALLAGNASVVRLPSKDFAQVDIICRVLRETLAEFPAMQPYFLLVRYGHERELNDYLSARSRVRVIWGGDATIAEVRRSPLAPRGSEITFADRQSLAVVGAAAYNAAEDRARIATDFYNDTYLTDQNACTAPFLVAWLGDEESVAQARCEFWAELRARLTQADYQLEPVQAVDKLTALYELAAAHDVREIPSADNLITRVELSEITADLERYRAHSGFFMEYRANEVADLLSLLNERCQTISYYGLDGEQLRRELFTLRPAGVDRVVPMGHTLDFALTWDGYDLIRSMSRVMG